MKTLGLVGFPVSHSKSPQIFQHFFEKLPQQSDWEYRLFPLQSIDMLPELLKKEPNLTGFNVTIPHKQSILSFLHDKDDTVMQCGACNTVLLQRNNNTFHLKGYNTDVFGFEKALLEFVQPHGKSALVLGSGGSSKAVIAILKKLNISFQVVSRTPHPEMIGYGALTEKTMNEHSIIVNTTPLGMSPETETAANIPYTFISSQHHCFDLVYNPAETLFMRRCRENGAQVSNGMKMLQYQAEAAWDLFVKNSIL